MATPQRLIVGISGASGVVYGIRMLEALRDVAVESHLVMSKSAEMTASYESPKSGAEIRALADVVHKDGDLGALPSSGSFKTLGMVVAPCSIRSMSEIATGTTTTLLTRAADVTVKEKRRLVLMVRETPLHAGHLRNMLALAEMGAVIAPPVPAFYTKPQSLSDMVDHTIGRVLDLFDIDNDLAKRWDEIHPKDDET